jgi:prostaglandin-E synthase 1
MIDVFHSAAFGTFALFATALCMILVSIDMFGVALLPRKKLIANSEAERSPTNGAGAGPPQGPALVMAAHRNAVANVVPFLLMMFLYVLLGASEKWVLGLCGVFIAMRLVHAVAHIRALQPWRTIVWLVGQFCLFTSFVQVARAAFALV